MKRLVFVVIASFAVTVWAAQTINQTKTFDFLIDITDETTKVVKRGDDFLLRDSFVYIESLSVSADTTTHTSVSWLSPLQVMILTPTFDASTTYSCSLRTGAGATGFSFDATGVANLAALIDKLVDSVNGVTGIKDTILAEDSVTYIKLVSEFGQNALPSDARWTLSFAVAGGSGALDTASQTTINDSILIANIVDSLNADDTASFYITAAVSGDTAYTITSNQPGLFFFVGGQKDTVGDTTTTTVNTSSSRKTTRADTIYVVSMINNSYSTIIGTFTIEKPSGIAHGVGLDDSVYFDIYTQLAGGALVEVYRDSSADLPATFKYTQSGTVLGTDTLFKDNIVLVFIVADTTTDSAFTVPLEIKYDFILRE